MPSSPTRLGRPDRRAVLFALTGLACVEVPAAAADDRAEPVDLPPPAARAVCPVCGMFVAKYPYWIATAVHRDGRTEHFDGAKDLWKYLLDLPRWAPGRSPDDIARAGVTGYYEGVRIDAMRAFYVVGSDVFGPMGHELVPHPDREDAEAFLADHQGRRILRPADLTLALLAALDDGRFE